MVNSHQRLKKVAYTGITMSALTLVATSNAASAATLLVKPQSVSAATNTNSGTKETIQNSDLTNAVSQAKSAGVNVTEAAGKTVTAKSNSAADIAAAKATIAADYKDQVTKLNQAIATQKANNEENAKTQAAAEKYKTDEAAYEKKLKQYNAELDQYNKDLEQYDKDVAAYNKAVQNPTLQGGTEWSKAELTKFLGKNAADVVTVAGGKLGEVSGTSNVTASTLASIKKTVVANGTQTASYFDKTYPADHMYYLKKGMVINWTKAFKDTSGNYIDVKVEVTGLSGFGMNAKLDHAYVLLKDKMSMTMLGKDSGTATFKVTYYKSGTNTPEKIDALIGFDDIDGGQALTMPNATSRLIGSALTTKNNTYSAASSSNNGQQDHQAWFTVKGASGFSFSYLDPYKATSKTQYANKIYIGSHFQIGNVDFAIKLPDTPVAPKKPTTKKPTPPTKPTNVLKTVDATYYMDTLEVPAPKLENLKITKTDSAGKVLSNTEFAIAATAADAKAGKYLKIDTVGNVVYPTDSNYNATDIKDYTAKTDSNGEFIWKNLAIEKHASSTYYVRELKTDGQHQLSTKLYTVNAYDQNGSIVNNTLKDDSLINLPDTGSDEGLKSGLLLSFITVIAGLGGYFTFKNKRSKKI